MPWRESLLVRRELVFFAKHGSILAKTYTDRDASVHTPMYYGKKGEVIRVPSLIGKPVEEVKATLEALVALNTGG